MTDSVFPILALQDLSFTYRDRSIPALSGATLEIRAGEFVLVAGASGSGKTTLVRCINGLAPRSYKGTLTGELRLMGQSTTDWSLSRISQVVGTVLQDPERQILGTRVLNEVAFGLENLGLPRLEIRQRAQDALVRLGIAHLGERETFNLSGGEKQKVALAGVLAMRPALLLLDEPLASLDPASAIDTLQLVRRLVDEGIALIMVEHRVEDVLPFRPDRVTYMDQGQVRYLGDVDGLNRAVDYRQIKLPAPVILERSAAEPAQPWPVRPPRPADLRQEDCLVSFQHVSFGYEGQPDTLKDVNLDIHRGDVIAILGPNGAGKTTLVKHAIGLLKPRSGKVLVGGRETRSQSIAQIARQLGYVFQSPSHMLFAPTVKEELSFGPANLGFSPAEVESQAKEALQIVHLDGREQDPPLALSFGQQKRVSIAAILAMRSRILVMDEPTAGQDYRNYMDFMDSIMALPNFEAILFITHDVDLAVVYANRVLLVSDGRLVADGSPETILKDQERMRALRLSPTSLLKLNLHYYPVTGRMLRAEQLAYVLRQNDPHHISHSNEGKGA